MIYLHRHLFVGERDQQEPQRKGRIAQSKSRDLRVLCGRKGLEAVRRDARPLLKRDGVQGHSLSDVRNPFAH